MFQHLVESLPRRVEAVIAAMFQHLVESLPRRVEAVIASPVPYRPEAGGQPGEPGPGPSVRL
uniref:Uncharacterized protein n=1 Tax=Oncorhynchus tshawytscha TaxID=74940 RepID=A0AAZ3PAL7_ONCTS